MAGASGLFAATELMEAVAMAALARMSLRAQTARAPPASHIMVVDGGGRWSKSTVSGSRLSVSPIAQ